MNTHLLDVIIPTYRRADLLGKLLTSLLPQQECAEKIGIIVVNDGSHDSSYADTIRRYDATIDYVVLDHSGGPANARNIGAQRSGAAYVAFLDDDCVAPPHWMNWLLALIDTMPEVDVFGGPTRPPAPEAPKAVERFNRAFGFYPRPLFFRGRLYCLPSANVAIRRDAFVRAGGFDVSFKYAAGEDLNLFYRMAIGGSTIHIDHHWYVYHPVADNLKSFIRRWYRYGYGTAQHVIKSGDAHDFGFKLGSTYLSIIKELPGHLHYMRSRLERGQRGEWLHTAGRDWPWEVLYFPILAGVRQVAYRIGGAHAFVTKHQQIVSTTIAQPPHHCGS